MLLASTCFAQDQPPPTPAPDPPPAQAIIDGPDSGYAGDLIILNWQKSAGVKTLVIPPASLTGKVLINTTDKQLGFSTRTPGTYEFYLIVSDQNAEMVWDSKVVTVTTYAQPPPVTPPPTEPPPVTPPPISGWQDLMEVSKAGAVALNDPETATALAKDILDLAPRLAAAASLNEAYELSSLTVEMALLKRRGESLKKPWLEKWRKPVNNKLNESVSRLQTPADFANAMVAVAEGLVP